LKKEASLDETVEDLKPLFPIYAERDRSIEDVLRESPEKRQKVLDRLRLTAEPFTPTDKVVEQQQGTDDRRDSVLIHAVPGGADDYVGQLLLKEGVCRNENLIIESGDGNIYSYFVRDGLPYYALKLDGYRKDYERYTKQLGNIPPHTHEGPHELIEPPSESIRSRVGRLVLVAPAHWGQDVVHVLPDGRVRFSYEVQAPQGFKEQKEDTHADMGELVRWLAENIDVFKRLDGRVDAVREDAPESYQDRLSEAYERADEQDGRALRVALHNAGLSLLGDGPDDDGRVPGSNGAPA
jgi:hypothetical protein